MRVMENGPVMNRRFMHGTQKGLRFYVFSAAQLWECRVLVVDAGATS